MEICVAGKTNVGKTSFFSAATMVDAEISNRVFTTIKPNVGVTYVRSQCPCKALDIKCNPNNSRCVNGTRLIPVRIRDIAGLVPGAHIGKGLGNQFLSDIMEADGIIHVVDLSGSTSLEGNPVPAGTHDPEKDIEFFEEEIDYWLLDIIKRIPRSQQKEFPMLVQKQLSGLKLKPEIIALELKGLSDFSDENLLSFLRKVRRKSKPVLIAGNKIDVPGAETNYRKLKESYDIVPCSAESELALRKAEQKGIVQYIPGDSTFTIVHAEEKQRKALDFIKHLMEKFGSTGVQQVIDKAVFDLLDMIVVYPVENENKFSDKKGNVLPDAILIKRSSTSHDLAYKIHEDIGKKFISAVDARTKKTVAADYQLKNGDIISIKAGR